MFITIDSAAGKTIAAPKPCSPRIAIRKPSLVREPGAERRGGEDRQAEHEDPPSPEQIGRAPAEQQEAAEGQPVGGDDPLQVRLGEVELAPIVGSATLTIVRSTIVMK